MDYYDAQVETRYEMQEREYVAEQTRMWNEARTAFAKAAAMTPAPAVNGRCPRCNEVHGVLTGAALAVCDATAAGLDYEMRDRGYNSREAARLRGLRDAAIATREAEVALMARRVSQSLKYGRCVGGLAIRSREEDR